MLLHRNKTCLRNINASLTIKKKVSFSLKSKGEQILLLELRVHQSLNSNVSRCKREFKEDNTTEPRKTKFTGSYTEVSPVFAAVGDPRVGKY